MIQNLLQAVRHFGITFWSGAFLVFLTLGIALGIAIARAAALHFRRAVLCPVSGGIIAYVIGFWLGLKGDPEPGTISFLVTAPMVGCIGIVVGTLIGLPGKRALSKPISN